MHRLFVVALIALLALSSHAVSLGPREDHSKVSSSPRLGSPQQGLAEDESASLRQTSATAALTKQALRSTASQSAFDDVTALPKFLGNHRDPYAAFLFAFESNYRHVPVANSF